MALSTAALRITVRGARPDRQPAVDQGLAVGPGDPGHLPVGAQAADHVLFHDRPVSEPGRVPFGARPPATAGPAPRPSWPRPGVRSSDHRPWPSAAGLVLRGLLLGREGLGVLGAVR